jgi:hypothetical protein
LTNDEASDGKCNQKKQNKKNLKITEILDGDPREVPIDDPSEL